MKQKVNLKQSLTAGAMAAGVAVVINAILFTVFHRAGILTDDIFVQPNQPLTIVPIIMSSIVPPLIAAILFFLLEKYTSNGFKIFSIVSTILFVIFLVNPFTGIKGVTIGYALVLELMHLVVFLPLMFFLRKAVKSINH